MHRHSFPTAILALGIGLLTGATTAQAAIATWVSGTGTDTGTCPRTAPCRTFQFAHDRTNNNGAINVLSSGNFGPVIITKPISIVAEGVEAVINTATAADGGSAIIVQAASGVVSLRGLTIDLRGTDNFAIRFISGAALHVQDCVIRKTKNAIFFTPSGTSELFVADSVISNSSGGGIFVFPSGSGRAKVTLDRIRVENNAFSGIRLDAGGSTAIEATVNESILAGNVEHGISASGDTIKVTMNGSAAVNNDTGVSSQNNAIVRIGDSTVTGNATGLAVAGNGKIASYGTNQINGNGTDGAPTSTIGMK
jgi:hypothetical protein